EAAGKPEVTRLTVGPTALIFGYDDPILPVKTVVEYQRTARNAFSARSAFVEGQVFEAAQLTSLATMPTKDEMIAELAGMLQSPVANLVGLLQAAVQEFSGLLDARASQLETA